MRKHFRHFTNTGMDSDRLICAAIQQPHVNTWITTNLPTPEGCKAELARSADP